MTLLAAALVGAFAALAISTVATVVVFRRLARRHATALGDASRKRTDRAACRAMRDAGVDPATPTDLSFYLYFATLEAAERAGARVAALRVDAPRLGVEIQRAGRGAAYLCRVTMHAAPSEGTIQAASEQLHAVACEYGGTLDGWEVAVSW